MTKITQTPARTLLDQIEANTSQYVAESVADLVKAMLPEDAIEKACPRCKEHGEAGVIPVAAGYLCGTCGFAYREPDYWLKLGGGK